MLTLLECFPTFSSSVLVMSRLVRVILRVVDRIFGNCIYGAAPCQVAAFTFSLASFRSSFSLHNRSYATFSVFPSSRIALMVL
jgi:hypothetical protein